MPIVSGDLLYKYTGAGSHNAAQTDPNASLGNFRASSNITSGALNNLFDDVSGAESAAGDTEYRAVGLLNNHGSLQLQDAKVWISADTGNGQDDVSFAVEAPSVSETTGAIQTIVNESTAPTGVSWSDATSKATGLACPLTGGDMDAGEWFGIWWRRIISAGASAVSNEACTIRVEGDTAA
jgi:hypothetical protein